MTTAPGAGTGRFCYLVMEHADVRRVQRAARAIRASSPGALVKTLYNGHLSAADRMDLERHDVGTVGTGLPAEWGAWSLMERILEGLEGALDEHWDWLVLISGQDYPAVHLGRWEEDTRRRGVDGIVNARPVQTIDRELVERYTYRWHRIPGLGGAQTLRNRAVVHALWRASGRTDVLTMRHEGAAVWVGRRRRTVSVDGVWKGDLWMALSRRAVQVLLEREADGAGERFRTSLLADEAFTPTLLRAAGVRLVCEPVSLTLWTEDDPAHPRHLTKDDLGTVLSSGAPFARKVAGREGDQLAELLDEAVMAGDGREAP